MQANYNTHSGKRGPKPLSPNGLHKKFKKEDRRKHRKKRKPKSSHHGLSGIPGLPEELVDAFPPAGLGFGQQDTVREFVLTLP